MPNDSFALEDAYGGPPAGGGDAFGLEDAYALPPTGAGAGRGAIVPDPLDRRIYEGGQTAKRVAVGTGKNLASVGDLVLSVPAQMMSVLGDVTTRFGEIAKGAPSAEVARAGEAERNRILEKYSPHFLSNLMKSVGGEGESQVDRGMQTFMDLLERDARSVEERTGGLIRKEDYNSLINTVFAAGGAKAVEVGGKKVAERAGRTRGETLESIAAEQRVEAEMAEARQIELRKAAEARAAGLSKQVDEATGVQPPPTKKQHKARQAELNEAFSLDDAYANTRVAEAEGNAALRDARRAEGERHSISSPAPRTRAVDSTFAEEAPFTINRQPGLPPDQLALQSPGRTLDTALAKVAQGRRFDLTAEELAAVKASASSWNRPGIALGAADPKLLAALGIGTGGLLLALQYPDKEGESLTAAIGGALLIGKGRGTGLSLADLAALPEGAKLGDILNEHNYTLKTLDRLPQGKAEIGVQTIRDQLARPDVSGPERALFEDVLKGVTGDKVSAKELVSRVKLATQDWELQARRTDEFADYGLDAIGRGGEIDWVPEGENRAAVDKPGAPARTTLYRLPQNISNANHFGDANLFGWTRSFDEGGVRHVVEVQSDLAQKQGKGLTPEERAGLEADLENVRRQYGIIRNSASSRLLMYIDLEPEAFLNSYNKLLDELEKFNPDVRMSVGVKLPGADFNDPAAAISAWMERTKTGKTDTERLVAGRHLNKALEAYQERLRVLQQEHTTKLEAKGTEGLDPILKHWPRRLIREELGHATAERAELQQLRETYAKMGDAERVAELDKLLEVPPVVRFATADTVAKVEGWPEQAGPERIAMLEQGIRDLEGDIQTGSTRRVPTAEAAQRTIDAMRAEIARVQAGTADRFAPKFQSIYDRYSRDITKFLKTLDGKEVTDAQGHTWIEVPLGEKALPSGRVQMLGRADASLVQKIGAAGAGAALGAFLDSDSGLDGGTLLGAAAGLGLASKGGRALAMSGAELADKGLGVLSTRIGNLSQPILHRAREFERRTLTDTHSRIAAGDEFLRGLEKLKNPTLNNALITNNLVAAGQHIPAALRPAWLQTRAALAEVGMELQRRGLLTNLRPDYFPRVVKDLPGLLEKLGSAEKTSIEAALAKANAANVKAGGAGLSAAEEAAIINKHLQNPPRPGQPGFTQQRRIHTVTQDLEPFYATPVEAYHSYMAAATSAIERARFFGRDLVTKQVDGQQVVDLNSSIGRVVQAELDAGKITPKQAIELGSMLRSRFASEQGSAVVQTFRNLTNIGLLGNIISAGTQLGDLGTSVALQGLRPSVEAVARSIVGRGKIHMRDFGLADHLSEEFVTTTKSAKALNTAFKLSGFTAVDTLGKNTTLNAALIRYQNLARTPKGEAQIARKYAEGFGADYPALLEELRSRQVGEQTRSLLFSELSDAQPITRLEVPQAYLDMPNGRVLYMLKTFMLKQADIVRREAYAEIKKGNVARGVGNLTRYALALGISGMAVQDLKDWILGRPFTFSAEEIPLNIIKTFGWSQYMIDQARQGKAIQGVAGMAAPPFRMWDDIVRQDPKAVRYIPGIGPLLAPPPHDPKAPLSDEEKARREEARFMKQLKE